MASRSFESLHAVESVITHNHNPMYTLGWVMWKGCESLKNTKVHCLYMTQVLNSGPAHLSVFACSNTPASELWKCCLLADGLNEVC